MDHVCVHGRRCHMESRNKCNVSVGARNPALLFPRLPVLRLIIGTSDPVQRDFPYVLLTIWRRSPFLKDRSDAVLDS